MKQQKRQKNQQLKQKVQPNQVNLQPRSPRKRQEPKRQIPQRILHPQVRQNRLLTPPRRVQQSQPQILRQQVQLNQVPRQRPHQVLLKNSQNGTSTSESKQPAKPVTPTAPAEKPVEQPAASTPQPEIVPPVTNETVGLVEDDETFTVSKTKKTEEFIQEIGESARKVAKDKNLYASVMIAQAILESGSGNSKLSQKPNYNLFGIKGDYKGQSVSFITYEDNGFGNLYTVEAKFRQYQRIKNQWKIMRNY